MRAAHLVAGHLIIPALEKQEVLEGVLVQDQLSTLREILVREIEILRIERKLDRQIQLHMRRVESFQSISEGGRVERPGFRA